ncbi:type I-E CRISPR-associated protein Cas5/CasD [Corynebacterium ulcerans]|uniref:type I-E CRISPR-associated protein Cas5/CasD n=1 Tax=Corynebacterium ulcerans TaxID=65058 RepID=UPI000C76DEFA|nr:type I-E CRISPR-associated protein Cas5/CasD [Corynebacterium ulcerans]
MTTTSVYLRLAGPLQSWAGPAVTGNFVRTGPIPTHSALVGLIAGACGYRRDEWPDWLNCLNFRVRVDHPGKFVDDFQTVSAHEEEMLFRERLILATGKRPSAKTTRLTPDGRGMTSIIQRTYLAEAEFIVEVASDTHGELLRDALRAPKFSTYLGRKAFAPAFPFYLGATTDVDVLHRIPACDLSGAKRDTARVQIHHCSAELHTSAEHINVPAVQERSDWLEKTKVLFA